jgi:hypothetical protein
MALSQQAKIREETPGPSAGGPGVLPTPHLAEQACGRDYDPYGERGHARTQQNFIEKSAHYSPPSGPSSLRRGKVVNIVVRQVTNAFGTRPPPPAIAVRDHAAAVVAPAEIAWRRVLGAFQLTIPVRTKEVLLLTEERDLVGAALDRRGDSASQPLAFTCQEFFDEPASARLYAQCTRETLASCGSQGLSRPDGVMRGWGAGGTPGPVHAVPCPAKPSALGQPQCIVRPIRSGCVPVPGEG